MYFPLPQTICIKINENWIQLWRKRVRRSERFKVLRTERGVRHPSAQHVHYTGVSFVELLQFMYFSCHFFFRHFILTLDSESLRLPIPVPPTTFKSAYSNGEGLRLLLSCISTVKNYDCNCNVTPDWTNAWCLAVRIDRRPRVYMYCRWPAGPSGTSILMWSIP